MKKRFLRLVASVLVALFLCGIFLPQSVPNSFYLALETNAGSMAWKPNDTDLNTAIKNANFTSYFQNTTAWLNSKMPLDTNSFSKLTMQNLISDPVFAKILAQRHLILKVGLTELKSFALKGAANKVFLGWLMNNTTALNLFLESGLPATEIGLNDGRNSKYIDSLNIWMKIYVQDVNSKNGIYLKIAIATALAHAKPMTPLGYDNSTTVIIDPVKRYFHFKNAYDKKELYPIFSTLSTWELRNVVNAWGLDSELTWMRQMIPTFVPDFNTVDNISNSAGLIEYLNPVPAYSYKELVKVGGVCGAISFTGSFASQAFGLPAYTIGQPAHAAFLYMLSNHQYNIGNNISGWDKSWDFKEIPLNIFRLENDYRLNAVDFSLVERLQWFARSLSSLKQAAAVLNIAKDIQPRNYSVWKELIRTIKSDINATSLDCTNLYKDMYSKFLAYPEILYILIKDINDIAFLNKIDKGVLTQYAQDVIKKISNGENPQNIEELWGMYNIYKQVVDLPMPFLLPSQLSATDSSHQEGESASNLVDGNLNVGLWHTVYDNIGPVGTFPYSATIKFDKVYDVDKVVYWPRQSGGNGIITAYNLYASNDGVTFTKITSGTWSDDAKAKVVTFPHVNTQYIKLEATNGVNGFAGGAELQIFKYQAIPTPMPLPIPEGLPRATYMAEPQALPTPTEKPEAPISITPSTVHYEIENNDTTTGRIINCDTGGKQLSLKPNQFVEYTVNATVAGSYGISLRMATPYSNGIIEVRDTNNTTLAKVPLENTTGFWKTTNTVYFNLPQGIQKIRLHLVNTQAMGVALRWFDLIYPNGAPIPERPKNILNDYVYCAEEGQSFTLPGKSDVAFGIFNANLPNMGLSFLYGQTGTITFNTVLFGDPNPNVRKKGYYKLLASVNRTPLANAQSVSTSKNTGKDIILSGRDSDGDILNYVIVTSPTKGTLSGTAPNIKYTPNANYVGNDKFTFKVTDTSGAFAQATVSITVTATSGAPAGYTFSAAEGQTVSFGKVVDVAYGANGLFKYKYNVTGSITFDNTTFGDPISGTAKAGYYKINYSPYLLSEFFDFTTSLSKLPDLTGKNPHVKRTTDLQINFPSVSKAWKGLPKSMVNTFASRHTGYIYIDKADDYKFYLKSNDGSKLWIDNALVINNDGVHGMREYNSKIMLNPGHHKIRIEFFENTGEAGLIFSWSSSNFSKRVVESRVLYH